MSYTAKHLLELDLPTTKAGAEAIGKTYLAQSEDERLLPVEVRYTDPAGERQTVECRSVRPTGEYHA